MKLDKDTLVKHQFWFLLGTFFLLWVVAVFALKVAADEPIKTAEKKYKDSATKLKTASNNPKNPTTFCPPWEQYSTVIDQHKQVIWNKAWDLQNGMYDWPEDLVKAKDMSTPQTELSQDERERYKRNFYPDEVKALKAYVEGDPKKGVAGLLGPVELAGGFDNIFKPQEMKEPPTREECWLIQEDFWVKRELFYVVNNAMASQAYMYPIAIDEKEEPMPEGVLYRHRFRNQNWEITLLIKQNESKELVISANSTIKNIHPNHHAQSLTSAKGAGIVFNVFQDKAATAFEVRGEPVEWNKAQKFGTEDYKKLGSIDWSKTKDHPVVLSQAFDWTTCPIRRIEAVAVGQQSCRTFTSPLQPNEALAKLDAPKEDPDANKNQAPAPGGPPMPGASPGMPGGPMGAPPGGPLRTSMGMNGGAAGQQAAPVGNPTPNNAIERNRYLQAPKKDSNEAEKPSRHLPLAIQLIVDPAHMSDVLVALANSRLRMQITQVEFHHVKDIKQGDSDKNGGSTQLLRTGYMPLGMARNMMPPGMGRGMMPPRGSGRMPPSGMRGMPLPTSAGMRGMPRMPGMGGMPRMPGMPGSGNPYMPSPIVRPGGMPPRLPTSAGPSTGDSETKTPGNQNDDNLVSMTIYGISTLYRRPDPPKSDSQAAQPGQPNPAAPVTPPAPGGARR